MNALLLAGSLNVVGNRFQEALLSAFFSGLTVGVFNITQQNISTHCLIALGFKVLHNDNLALEDVLLPEFCSGLEEKLLELFR